MPSANRTSARGNALFLILIAVALFAALSYAVTQTSRGGGNIDNEQAILDAALAEQCTAYVERGINVLQLINGCSSDQISYELPNGTNENSLNPSNTSCFLFHPNGAGMTACGVYASGGCPDSVLATLAVGQTACGSIAYAGMSGGNRIYTTLADVSADQWNNGSANWVASGANSNSDGLTNTNTLVNSSDAGSPYTGALLCRSLGTQWYLPAADELNLLYTIRNTGAFSGTFSTAGGYPTSWYWSSTEGSTNGANRQDFSNGAQGNLDKRDSLHIRCVRR